MNADEADLRRRLLAVVRDRAGAVSDPVAEALLAVPRHAFLPEMPIETAYRDEAIVTKRDAAGVAISSSSQPTIMALMLDQLDPAPGQRVLEIGAGTGYNAALLARLVGPSGVVVSADIDPQVVQRAAAILAAAGYPHVTVVCADGSDGYAAAAPYDRIIASVGVWDLAPAWLDQLAPAGRIVVPLDLRGPQVSVAFERWDGQWASRSVVPCGFMRLRGSFAGPEQVHMLDRDTGLVLTVPDDRPVDDAAVRSALAGPSVRRATEVVVSGSELFGGLRLWLALTDERTCALSDEDRGSPVLERAPMRMPGFRATGGVFDGSSIAVLGCRSVVDGMLELDAYGHGPDGARLAADLADQTRAWAAVGRPDGERWCITAYPRNARVPDGGFVIDKAHTRLRLARTAAVNAG